MAQPTFLLELLLVVGKSTAAKATSQPSNGGRITAAVVAAARADAAVAKALEVVQVRQLQGVDGEKKLSGKGLCGDISGRDARHEKE